MFKTVRRDIRVEVTPTALTYGTRTEREEIEACKRIAIAVRRHVDVVNASVLYDTVRRCEFCGADWEAVFEDASDPFFCCGAAEDEWLAEWGYPR